MVATASRPQQVQLDLFSAVLHSYTAEREGRIDNATLYDQVASRAGIDPDEFARKSPVGRDQQPPGRGRGVVAASPLASPASEPACSSA